MDIQEQHDRGLKLRVELFGKDAVEQRSNAFGEFGKPLQHIINAYAYGDVWSRSALPLATKSLAMVAMGPIAGQAMSAAQRLAPRGVDCAVAVVASVSPAPIEDLARFLEGRDLVLTVEVHYPNGGVGSLVSEVVAERGLSCRVMRCGVPTMPAAVAGSQAYLERLFGLSEDQLAEAVLGAR